MKTYTIYKITHTSSGKSYIGASTNPQRRLYSHRHHSPQMFEGGYCFAVLREGLSRREAENAEHWLILEHKTIEPDGFNKRGGGFTTYEHEMATRLLMSQRYNRNRRKKPPETPEVIAAKSARVKQWYADNPGKHPQLGKPRSKEARAKQRAAMLGKPSAFKGRVHTEESRQKIRDARQRAREAGVQRKSPGPISEERKAKQRATLLATNERKRREQGASAFRQSEEFIARRMEKVHRAWKSKTAEERAAIQKRVAETKKSIPPEVKAAAEARRVESRRRNRLAKLAAATTLPT